MFGQIVELGGIAHARDHGHRPVPGLPGGDEDLGEEPVLAAQEAIQGQGEGGECQLGGRKQDIRRPVDLGRDDLVGRRKEDGEGRGAGVFSPDGDGVFIYDDGVDGSLWL